MSTHPSRRRVLAGLAGAALLPAIPRVVLAQARAIPASPDVAIVGAVAAGLAAARRDLARPVADRIFFAGEALAGEFAQTCGGAALSGEATAQAVLKVLG